MVEHNKNWFSKKFTAPELDSEAAQARISWVTVHNYNEHMQEIQTRLLSFFLQKLWNFLVTDEKYTFFYYL